MPPSTKKPRHNGPWSPLYGQAWDHKKTAAAVEFATSNDRKIPRDCAPSVILGWLNRLNLWCLSNSEEGVIGTLPDARLALIAWPEGVASRVPARLGATIRGSLRAGGFLDGHGETEAIHEFRWHHRGVLYDRNRKRIARDGDFSSDTGPDESEDNSSDMSGDKSEDRSGASEPGRVGSGRDGSNRGGSGRAEPPTVSPPAPPEPDSVASLSRALAAAADEEPDVAEKVIRELLAVGIPANFIRARIGAIEHPIGGWAWKRSVVDAWREANPAKATNDHGPRTASTNGAKVAEIEAANRRAQADLEAFQASGYASRSEYVRDKAAGKLKPPPSETRAASCGPKRHAPLTARRPLAAAQETPP